MSSKESDNEGDADSQHEDSAPSPAQLNQSGEADCTVYTDNTEHKSACQNTDCQK